MSMKVSVDNVMLRDLAHRAKDGGKLDNFVSLVLDWADQATAHVNEQGKVIEELKAKLDEK